VAGFLQPFRDAIKLFVKERVSLAAFDFALYYFCPVIRMVLILIRFAVIE
jgi:NADH:ubiquinone oxidoreductase subunit H